MNHELYQEIILDHNRRPRNFGPLPGANRTAEGNNPLCGDRITLYVELDGERIANVSFEGAGCAISTASASLMTEALRGKTVAEARALFDLFHRLVTEGEAAGDGSGGIGIDAEADKLAVFSSVRAYPMRVKCATLAWHTLKSALDQAGTARTEGPQAPGG
jgi:nitrogen fixation protein NifU and related proteins